MRERGILIQKIELSWASCYPDIEIFYWNLFRQISPYIDKKRKKKAYKIFPLK